MIKPKYEKSKLINKSKSISKFQIETPKAKKNSINLKTVEMYNNISNKDSFGKLKSLNMNKNKKKVKHLSNHIININNINIINNNNYYSIKKSSSKDKKEIIEGSKSNYASTKLSKLHISLEKNLEFQNKCKTKMIKIIEKKNSKMNNLNKRKSLSSFSKNNPVQNIIKKNELSLKYINNFKVDKYFFNNNNFQLFVAVEKRFSKKYIIKKYPINKNSNINNEIEISKKINFKNLLKFIHSFDDEGYSYIMYNYENEIDLNSYFKTHDRFKLTDNFFINIFHQILSALNYLKSIGYSHGDLKLENVIINKENNNIKIINYENCIAIGDYNNKTMLSSFHYMSPEILMTQNYNSEKAEVWAFGVLIFKIIYNLFPFRGNDQRDLLIKINTKLNFPNSKKINNNLKDLIKDCLNKDQSKRSVIEDILKYSLFN